MMRFCIVVIAAFTACAATHNGEVQMTTEGIPRLNTTSDGQEKLSAVLPYGGHYNGEHQVTTEGIPRLNTTSDGQEKLSAVLPYEGHHNGEHQVTTEGIPRLNTTSDGQEKLSAVLPYEGHHNGEHQVTTEGIPRLNTTSDGQEKLSAVLPYEGHHNGEHQVTTEGIPRLNTTSDGQEKLSAVLPYEGHHNGEHQVTTEGIPRLNTTSDGQEKLSAVLPYEGHHNGEHQVTTEGIPGLNTTSDGEEKLSVVLPYEGHHNGEVLVSTKGMQLLSITCDSDEKASIVHSYVGNQGFDFLTIPKALEEDYKVFVAANVLSHFKTVLGFFGISYKVIVENVATKVHECYSSNERARENAKNLTGSILSPFEHYPRVKEINSYLKNLAIEYKDTMTLSSIGSSFEGRLIPVVKISSGPGDKPAVLIDAGIHAREWIAPTTALWAIHQLVVNKTNAKLYKNVDWYIIPCLNPDGYEFSHKKEENRLWRKTRSKNRGSPCYGTDANRNFDYKWMTVGASDDPCSEIYAGSKPFSEKETATLRDFILAKQTSIKLYVTLHSFGKYLAYPWGWTNTSPSNERVLHSLAVRAEAALRAVRGTSYRVGRSYSLLYPTSGTSGDWASGGSIIPLSYIIELPSGGCDFDPPPESIAPVGTETFEAFRVFGEYAASNYPASRVPL